MIIFDYSINFNYSLAKSVALSHFCEKGRTQFIRSLVRALHYAGQTYLRVGKCFAGEEIKFRKIGARLVSFNRTSISRKQIAFQLNWSLSHHGAIIFGTFGAAMMQLHFSYSFCARYRCTSRVADCLSRRIYHPVVS